MLITIKQFFKPKVTIEYPEVKMQIPDNFRGLPKLVMGDNNIPKCVACKLCEVVCPSSAIRIEIGEYPDQNLRERYPRSFEINYGRCICCGFCEEACPKLAIEMTKEYEFIGYRREDLIMDKERLLAART